MKVVIVGPDEIRLSGEEQWNLSAKVYSIIKNLATYPEIMILSGESPRGGVDKYVENCCNKLGIPYKGYPPKTHNLDGYRSRNKDMAKDGDVVICVTLKDNHDLCWHCGVKGHRKSGGCWTMKMASKLGKKVELIVI